MSHRHFAVIDRAFASVVNADLDAAEKLFDPEVEWHNTSVFPGDNVCKGPRAIIAFWRALVEDLADEGGTEIEQYAESHDRAVVGFHSLGTGRTSGVPLDVRWAALFELHDQRVTRVDVYGSYAKANQALQPPA